MPDEVFLFGSSAVLFIVLATLVTTTLWRWHHSPLPASLAPSLAVRLRQLFHG
jgi:hypothetical protein